MSATTYSSMAVEEDGGDKEAGNRGAIVPFRSVPVVYSVLATYPKRDTAAG